MYSDDLIRVLYMDGRQISCSILVQVMTCRLFFLGAKRYHADLFSIETTGTNDNEVGIQEHAFEKKYSVR